MAIFTKNHVINWGILFLVIVNISVLGTLGFLFFRRSPALEPAQRFLQDELQLTETQIQQVEELTTLYQGKMKILDDAGIDHIFDAGEISDGTLAMDLGVGRLGLELMEKTYRRISGFEPGKIIVMDPESYYGLKVEFKRHGFGLYCEVVH